MDNSVSRNIFNTPALRQSQPNIGKDDAERTAKDFEALFLTQAFEEMFKSVEGGMFSGGHAEKTWRSFLAQEYAKQVAESGETGISDSIEGMIRAYTENKK